MRTDQPQLPDDALDLLLAQACWPEVQAGAVDRLTSQWIGLRQPRRWPIRFAVAGLAVAASVAVFVMLRPPAKDSAPQSPIAVRPMMPQEAITPEAAERDAAIQREKALVRKPTPLETLRAMASQRAAPRSGPIPERSVPSDVDRLLVQLKSPRVDDRLSAAGALAARNDPAVTDRLVRLVGDAAVRREALAALLASEEPRARAFIAAAAQDRKLAAIVRSLEPHPDNL